MRKNKRYGLVALTSVIIIIALILTHSFLPPILREQGDLYTSFEISQRYLNDDKYTKLEIEVDHVQGFSPNDSSLNVLKNKINKFSDKEDINYLSDDTIPYQGIHTYTENEIKKLLKQTQDNTNHDDTLAMHVLYLDGQMEENSDVLGLAYKQKHIVVFEQRINEIALKPNTPDNYEIEDSVLIHEWGHLIGLVGMGYKSDHEDPEKENHCGSGYECVMNASVEIKYNGFSDETPPTDFCKECEQDIEKISNMEDERGIEETLTYVAMVGEFVIGSAWIIILAWTGEEEQGGPGQAERYPEENRPRSNQYVQEEGNGPREKNYY